MVKKDNRADSYLVGEIRATGLFQEDWYLEQYPDARASHGPAIQHFVAEGAALGHAPNALFDAAYYADQTGVSDPIQALLHYAYGGWKQGVDPSAGFLVRPYLTINDDVEHAGLEPLAHYLAYGMKEGRLPVTSEMFEADCDERERLLFRMRRSALFDASFYLAEYAHLLDDEGRHEPWLHYVRIGEVANCRPNPYFDPSFYRAQLPEDADEPANLLLDYEDKGWLAGLNPSAEFDAGLYRDIYGPAGVGEGEPLRHFLHEGRAMGLSPFTVAVAEGDADGKVRRQMADLFATGLFDSGWYLKINSDLAQHSISALEHYVRYGVAEGRWANAWFDTAWYRNRYRDQVGDELPLVFYATTGYRRMHDPCAAFSADLYFRLNRDLVPGHNDALRHYMEKGRAEGRLEPDPNDFDGEALYYLSLPREAQDALRMDIAASGLFDADWYRREYGAGIRGGLDPIEHYLLFGKAEGLNPNPLFDGRWYYGKYKLEIGDRHPLIYYAEEGWKKGDWPSLAFDPKAYLKANPDVKGFPGSPLKHYLCFGVQEGRFLPAAPGVQEAAKGSAFMVAGGRSLISPAMQSMIDFARAPLKPIPHALNGKSLDIHWVIPDFVAGGGGHMTIFRMISHLERQGHRITIWVHNPSTHKTPDEARETIHKHFQYVSADVRFVDLAFAKKAQGDAIVATDCWTVWPVMAAHNFIERFYFVQDFEPSFHPMGGKYLAAEQTYRQDLVCICASPWLADKLDRDYGRKTASFWLAADTKIYKPLLDKPVNKLPRIAFYSRIATDRRAVELGLLALELLARRGVKFHVDFFGGADNIRMAPFSFTDHGVMAPAELADLFGKADVGVVFSATNYSLVPQEMMACGLPLLELDGESTRAVYPEKAVAWADPDPVAIADELAALLKSSRRRAALAKAGRKWVGAFTWDKAARTVEDTIRTGVVDRIKAGAAEGCSLKRAAVARKAKPMASVVIPTYNAGPGLEAVLKAVCSQHTPWPYEVLVIDSGSTDETLDIVARFPEVRLHSIDKSTFNHGATRNLGASLTGGDFIAFLTHDAQPVNQAWLFNLVTALADNPRAAGAFGRHLAYPGASPYTKRDLDHHFDNMLRYPLSVSARTNARRYQERDEGWRQFLHFFSDNNSCLRRTVWEQIPYRPVVFGEDQVWADDIIAAGHEKLFAAQALVYHSHDFGEAETHERSSIESSFFKHFFGYRLMQDEDELQEKLAGMNAHDAAWGRAHGLDEDAINLRLSLNEARLRGYLDGFRADTDAIFSPAPAPEADTAEV